MTTARTVKEVGIWAGGGSADASAWARSPEGAAEIERLGYSELWISGGQGSGIAPFFAEALDATSRLKVASGIVSIYAADAPDVAAAATEIERAFPSRFILGLGNSHEPAVERLGRTYDKPYSAMVEYLDALDALAAKDPGSVGDRMLAALGPRMLRLSAERSLGAHPYFVPPEHTELARRTMGEGPRIATEQAVVLEADPVKAREIARRHTRTYLRLPNYTNNLRRLGWGDEDLLGEGSDALTDAIVAWGDPQDVAQRVRAHHDAGADIVLLQVLVPDADTTQQEAYRRLADWLI
jgi:probable F420-dependent oxidoreductase